MARTIAVVALLLLTLTACASNGPASAGSETHRANASSGNPGGTASGEGPACTGQAASSLNGKRMAIRLKITPCRVAPGEAPTAVLKNIWGQRAVSSSALRTVCPHRDSHRRFQYRSAIFQIAGIELLRFQPEDRGFESLRARSKAMDHEPLWSRTSPSSPWMNSFAPFFLASSRPAAMASSCLS